MIFIKTLCKPYSIPVQYSKNRIQHYSFATIGFGDYVSNQKDVTKMNGDVYRYSTCQTCQKIDSNRLKQQSIHRHRFRFLNFLLLTLGACCFYCLFNVSSIVVRQVQDCIACLHSIQCRSFLFQAIFELYDQEDGCERNDLLSEEEATIYGFGTATA